jgi:chromosomal replication initiation ATPase DnaA
MNETDRRGLNPERQAALPLTGATSYHAKDYVVTSSNAQAYQLITHWPKWPETRLAMTGPAGSGRTHLAHIWASQAMALQLQASDLMDGFSEALRKARTNDAFWLDDCEQYQEEALFHLLNLAREHGFFLLMTAREDYKPALADLASRWRALPKAALQVPDDALLEAALLKLFSDRQLKVAPEVISYLLPRIPRTLPAALQLVAEMDRLSLASKCRINLNLTRNALEILQFP